MQIFLQTEDKKLQFYSTLQWYYKKYWLDNSTTKTMYMGNFLCTIMLVDSKWNIAYNSMLVLLFRVQYFLSQ